MAVYSIFPQQDATIYSLYPTMNTGIDEILETTTLPNPVTANPETSRFLIKFPTDEIQDIINNKVNGTAWDAYLKVYLAYASSIPLNYTMNCHLVSQSWNMGTGKYLDTPQTTDGVSWINTDTSGSQMWETASLTPGVTSSYSFTPGGGNYYYSSSNLVSSQSFTYIDHKDLNFKVTDAISEIWLNTIPNNGFLIKLDDNFEFNSDTYFSLRYFSMDTHTIYPPALVIKWNDCSIITSSNAPTITNDNIVVSLGNNKSVFQQDSVQNFRINVRPVHPIRTFTTSSVYLNNYSLPSSSYYSIKDEKTHETIIDFDDVYTQLSLDDSGNFFTLYMSGLQPERNYKILIKSIINNETIIFENNSYIFKVIQ